MKQPVRVGVIRSPNDASQERTIGPKLLDSRTGVQPEPPPVEVTIR
jgi:hypothetical protein